MKKEQEEKSKLDIKKFQIAKIKSPHKIVGGNSVDDDETGNTAKKK